MYVNPGAGNTPEFVALNPGVYNGLTCARPGVAGSKNANTANSIRLIRLFILVLNIWIFLLRSSQEYLKSQVAMKIERRIRFRRQQRSTVLSNEYRVLSDRSNLDILSTHYSLLRELSISR